MKTPRDILLAHHRAAGPKLDALRHSVVVAAIGRRATTTIFQTLWSELVLPSRRIWSGLAAVWLLIVMINVSQRDHSPAVKYSSAPPMMSLSEQQRLMHELKLFADRSLPMDAEPPKTFTPKPRTETLQFFTA